MSFDAWQSSSVNLNFNNYSFADPSKTVSLDDFGVLCENYLQHP